MGCKTGNKFICERHPDSAEHAGLYPGARVGQVTSESRDTAGNVRSLWQLRNGWPQKEGEEGKVLRGGYDTQR